MESTKVRAGELATLGEPLDLEDLIEKVLDGLDENYQSVMDSVNFCYGHTLSVSSFNSF